MSTETPAATNPFSELVNALKAAFQPPSTPPSVSGSPMAMPATFAGEAAECSGFLLQVDLLIKMQPQLFTSDDAKVAFLISLLTGKALLATTGELATLDQLFRLQQGTSSVNHYTLHFRTLVAASGWNEKALLGAYRQGLNPNLRAAMVLYDDSIGLEAFLQRTTRVAQNLAACQPPITAPQPASVVACNPVPEPMQTDSTRLSHAERNRRICNGLCLYCGQPGHHLRQCPIRPPRPVVSTLSTEVEISSLMMLPVTLHTSHISSGNFVSQDCLNQLQLARRPHHQVLSVKTIQGKPLGRGRIRYSSPIITLQVDLFHHEDIKFLVLEDSTASIILGRPWLQQHHPELSWDPLLPIISSTSTRIESPDRASVPKVPAEYLAFQDVFSKQAATLLPPHRSWDCGIDLLPGAQLPKGRVYPLSIPECQTMEEYISEALAQGFIQPSTSPAASSFCFVGKKDGGLRPCIDYRQLNSQVIQQPYPSAQVFTKLDLWSPYNLVRICAGDEWKTAFVTPTGHYEYRVMPYGLSISPSVFQMFMNEVFRELLHRFVIVYIDDILIYSRNMTEHRHHIQQMDQGKVSVIQEWPQPLTVKELQRFLGFANFYRRFIKDYSIITAPLTSLLRGKPKTICWNPSAHKAFLHLKIFSTAPLLHHPDPELPFTVEVDASTTGAGAVLSQAVGEPPLLHPCAFYSRKLSLAEQNYDVGNRELLAIKLALEEWRHWLEGSKHPFTIITDHKNLQYIREAKRLNPRQARWALFFTRFNFKITYRPGFKNISADALSRLHSTDQPVEPEPIVPSNLITSAAPLSRKLLHRNVQNVSVNLSSGYHPQTNGQTERKIQELGRYLRAYCHMDQHCWSRFLPWAEYAQNSLRQDTTGLTPFQCVFGYQPLLFPWTEEPSNVPAVDHWFRESEKVWDSALRRHPTETCPRIPTWGPGLVVYTGSPPPPCYIGPFKILRRTNEVTFQLQLPPRYRIHPTFHVSLLKPCYASATEQPGAEVEPPPLEILEPPSIYTVHEILGSRRRGGQGMDLKSDPGSHGMTYWTPPYYLTSSETIRISLPLAVEVTLDVVLGCREPPLEEGVVSGIHHCHPHLTHLR
ncbi:hypothetical protein M9458_038122, partial [Cirrhinus mrigala]